MKKIFITVAVFLMLLLGNHKNGHHEHVHYETPSWEYLEKTEIHTSGATYPDQNLRDRS